MIASPAQMPVPPPILIGRDAVVNKIADHLVSADIARSRVFILAPGGKEKTSTALAVMKHMSVVKASLKISTFTEYKVSRLLVISNHSLIVVHSCLAHHFQYSACSSYRGHI